MGKRVRPNRPVERAAVRAAIAVFEDANFLVQPVDGSVDIGKDLYVDITEEDHVTGELIAVQVKGGVSYQRAGRYSIPCRANDVKLWADSTVPIFGIVHDPADDKLYWTNLSGWARAQERRPSPMEVPVEATLSLNSRTLKAFVQEARTFLSANGPPALLGLADASPEIQRAAILDAFALGRRDPRSLLLLRAALRYFDNRENRRIAVSVFALCVGHGDIFWHRGNWIGNDITNTVLASFDWSYDELCLLLESADLEEYQRGGMGQNVHAAVWPPGTNSREGLEEVVLRAPVEAAWPALAMIIEDAGDGALDVYDRLVPRARSLRDFPMAHELREILLAFGSTSMY